MNRREAILGILTLPCIEPIVKSIPKTPVIGIGSTEIPMVLPTKEFQGMGLYSQIPRENMLPYRQVTPEMIENVLKGI